MGTSPEELKAEIDLTRAELAADVDALAEKVSPTAVVRRSPVAAGVAVFGVGVLTGTMLRSRRNRAKA